MKKAFTLVEIILVVVIIALLSGLVLTKIAGKGKQARIAAAQAQIANLKSALNNFEIDCGRFPTTAEGLDALITRPSSLGDNVQWRAYLDDNKLPQDPWGKPYIYLCPGTINTDGFDIYSAGPDGQQGTQDDIGNASSN
ncbi:MAG TPA: type II secretion system major pseudopilin GspG [Phycisphaerae bacterium]|nr:type II secretion system major pseudopilin GspG [Phycisphaerae bacterium]HPS52645.1 type II secretion system major pseudopilin GspG [Phycisphaerae bacterium]